MLLAPTVFSTSTSTSTSTGVEDNARFSLKTSSAAKLVLRVQEQETVNGGCYEITSLCETSDGTMIRIVGDTLGSGSFMVVYHLKVKVGAPRVHPTKQEGQCLRLSHSRLDSLTVAQFLEGAALQSSLRAVEGVAQLSTFGPYVFHPPPSRNHSPPFFQPSGVYTVGRAYAGGDLFDFAGDLSLPHTNQSPVFTASVLEAFALRMLRVCVALSCRGILHSDVKPENILLGTKGDLRTAVLSDFDFATDVSTPKPWGKGTLLYIAPEQRGGGNVTCTADVWAMGIVLLELYLCATEAAPSNARFSWFSEVKPDEMVEVFYGLLNHPDPTWNWWATTYVPTIQQLAERCLGRSGSSTVGRALQRMLCQRWSAADVLSGWGVDS